MTIEAIKEALDALEYLLYHDEEPDQRLGRAVYVLQNAVKEAEKPVATVKLKIEKRFIRGSDMGLGCSDGYVTNRYLTLEFINYNMNDPEKSCFKDGDVLYTTPPAAPRPWVGLTDDEIEQIADSEYEEAFIRLIEAKLKEKNT